MIHLQHFIGRSQATAIADALCGEEGEFFDKMIKELIETINIMPKTYETDGMGGKALVTLHYFKNASDWYIIERDCEEEQLQAFGYVCLNGWKDSAELGYINIEELIQYGVELDLYFTPTTVDAIRNKIQGGGVNEKRSPAGTSDHGVRPLPA